MRKIVLGVGLLLAGPASAGCSTENDGALIRCSDGSFGVTANGQTYWSNRGFSPTAPNYGYEQQAPIPTYHATDAFGRPRY